MDSGSYLTDTYVFPNPTRVGHITNVRVSFFGYCNPYYNGYQKGKTALYGPGAIVYGAEVSLLSEIYYTDYALSPWTGVAWTWDEIDSLEAGFALKAYNESNPYAMGRTSRLKITSFAVGGQHRVIGMML